MAWLRRSLLALLLLWVTPAGAKPADRWSAYVEEASSRFGVPAQWIRRVMQAESGGRTTRGGRPIVSRAGAMGLMQIMPDTWAELRAVLDLGSNPHEPRDNILAGTYYLRRMHDRFGYPGLFAAYNAGPARYAQHLATGRRLPRETIAYVAYVLGSSPAPPTADNVAPPISSLFALRSVPGPASDAERTSPLDAPADLFVALSTAASR